MGEHRALGPAGGPGRVHDQRRAVVGDVHRIGLGTWLGEHVVVAEHRIVGTRAGDDDRLQRRIDVTDRGGDVGQHRLGDDELGLAVVHQECDLGRGHPEVHGHSDGAELVDRQKRFDELGAIEHQDQHPIAELDSAAAQRTGQGGDAPIEVAPGGRPAEKPQRRGVGLHQRVPGELIGPVLAARQIRLLGQGLLGQRLVLSLRRVARR